MFDSNQLVRLQHKFDLTSLVQRFSKCRSKNALNSIYKSCKLQNNWFKCDELPKCHKNTDSPICETLSPPRWRRERQFRDREWRAIESNCWHRTAWRKCVFPVSWTLNIIAWDVNCLFAIKAVERWTAGKRNKDPTSTVFRHFASQSYQ